MIAPLTPPAGAAPAKPADDPRLVEAAQAFEAIFLRDLIGSMRAGSLGDDLFGNGGVDQFRDMMDDRLADDMAQTNGIGIAAMLLSEWRER